jgi:hypothetical protein
LCTIWSHLKIEEWINRFQINTLVPKGNFFGKKIIFTKRDSFFA